MRKITVAATQMACSWDADENIQRAEDLVGLAAEDGAQIILLQELFQTPYFCLEQNPRHFDLACAMADDKAVAHFRVLAKQLGVAPGRGGRSTRQQRVWGSARAVAAQERGCWPRTLAG